MPIPLWFAFGFVVSAAIGLCGFESCAASGRGWGLNATSAMAVLALAAAVTVIAGPAAAVPWHPSGRVRAAWSTGIALVLVGGAWAAVGPG